MHAGKDDIILYTLHTDCKNKNFESFQRGFNIFAPNHNFLKIKIKINFLRFENKL